ncbi:MAG: Fic family protein, partial [Actinomycetota bacterium]
YLDGNGRLGRLVAMLQLLSEGHLRAPVLSVSPWLKDHATEYRDHLLAVSQLGEWEAWIGFFAKAIAAQARDGHDRIMRLLELKAELGETVRGTFPRGRLTTEIADNLIAYPVLSVSMSQAIHGRTDQANRNAIHQLVDIGLLEPFSDVSYGRLYWNRRVFQVADRTTRPSPL